MFDSTTRPPAGSAAPSLSNAELVEVRSSLRGFDASLDDAARVERIRRLAELKAAVAAAQAVEVAAFTRSRRAVTAAEIAATPVPGVGTRRRLVEAERGIVSDVALARRDSPAQASQFMTFALTAADDLPAAFAQFAAGQISERRLLSVHRATAWLRPDQRRAVDAELAPRLPGWGDKQVLCEATTAAYRADPEGACARVAAAEADRRVTLRPAPDAMTWLTALLPLTQGVAAWKALDQAARTARATGDPRGRGQVMADTLVERLTGQKKADAVPVEVQLVISEQTLTGEGPGADEPAHVVGHGPLPAGTAREWVLRDLGDTGSTPGRTIRRLFTGPAGHLVAMETSARRFTDAMAHFVRVRDDTCRTPWCDAPIRHIDHVHPAAQGGPTGIANARGLCERCNLAQQAPDSISRTVPSVDAPHTVVGLTPMGRAYRSRSPGVPHTRPVRQEPPAVDLVWVPHSRAA